MSTTLLDILNKFIGEDINECPPECTPTMHEQMEAENNLKAELRANLPDLVAEIEKYCGELELEIAVLQEQIMGADL